MSFTMFISIIFIDIILISLAAKTKVFENIIVSIKMIMPQIIMAFIILAPLWGMSLLINICNNLTLNKSEPNIIETVNKNSYLMGLKTYGLDLIAYSPLVLLILCFIVQADIKITKEDKSKTIEEEYKRLKVSMIFNNTAISILMLYIFIDILFIKKNFPIKLIHFVKTLNLDFIITNPEVVIKMCLIFILVIIYYLGIFVLPKHFLKNILSIDTNSLIKKKYLFLIIFPLINMLITKYIKEIIYNKNRKNGI